MKIPERTYARDPRVEILPLIDVVFLVLAAFIYASMFMTAKSGLPISLPDASQAESQSPDSITLAITKEGDLYLDERNLSITDLEQALRVARIAKPDAVLLVMADREADIGRLVQVMDTTRLAGIAALTIQVKPNPDAVEDQ